MGFWIRFLKNQDLNVDKEYSIAYTSCRFEELKLSGMDPVIILFDKSLCIICEYSEKTLHISKYIKDKACSNANIEHLYEICTEIHNISKCSFNEN